MCPENRGNGSGSNGSYFFKRREEKYVLHIGAAAFLRSEVQQNLPLFEFRRGQQFTYITTVYFDTEKLDLYHKARNFYDDNLKVRIKEYYYQNRDLALPSGSPAWITFDYCFVEIKERIQGLVVKRRFEIPKRLLGRLLSGEDIWDELVASRSGIEFNGFVDAYREFRGYLRRNQITPKSIINYRRSVYQQDEHELRVTFDDEMAVFEPCPDLYDQTGSLARGFLGAPREVFSRVILEIKSQNGYPEWLSRILKTHMPRRLSKFTSSINVLAQELPQPASDFAMKDTHLVGEQPSGDTTQVSSVQL